MRRKDREKSKEFGYKVCDDCCYAVVSMTDTEGMPYCVAVNIVRVDDAIFFHSAKQGFKNNALQKNPNVCISCVSHANVIEERFTTEYSSAIIRGIASIVTDEQERRLALKQLCERHTPTAMHNFENEMQKSIKATEIWKITITDITAKQLT